MEPLNPHRLVYTRIVQGRRVRLGVETVDDYGFYLALRRGQDPAETAGPYAFSLTEDRLLRHPELRPAARERWFVTVDRVEPDGSSHRLCEIEVIVGPGPTAQSWRPVPAHQPNTSRCGRRKELQRALER
ncbi:hypothetical protein GCM10012275_27760 [Longimycelium tulufanense]|uniref:Uncharacterized protein n=1 Tax=Longimycelium tulufanense TaxID=907463 RepID=A0A8J3CCU6_9PSEU|nr:hypothetical protein [Longimycelium tulufanense]GGM55103.1 hypothetical protein GCM10012275_27760 [Longimycelium tulufanense]